MWFRLDDNFHGHPKVRRAGNAAVGLWVRCATYSADYGLDGYIPAEVAREYGKPAELHAVTKSGLWVPAEIGFHVPDFLEYNPSAEEVRAGNVERIDAKRRGGIARAAAAKRDEHGHFVTADTNGETW